MPERRGRGRSPAGEGLDTRREAQEAARREHGIDLLTDGEELIDEDSFARMQEELARAREHADGGPAAAPQAPGPDPADDELLLQEIVSEPTLRRSEPLCTDAPPRTPAEVAGLETQILAATDRDEVAHLALRVARAYAPVAALFVVHEGAILGLRGAGEGLNERVEDVMIPLNAQSVFARAALMRKATRFGDPACRIDERALRALGRREARDRLLVPVAIRDRVVNLLYADNGGDALAETSGAALRALAGCVARGYERLILERKRARDV